MLVSLMLFLYFSATSSVFSGSSIFSGCSSTLVSVNCFVRDSLMGDYRNRIYRLKSNHDGKKRSIRFYILIHVLSPFSRLFVSFCQFHIILVAEIFSEPVRNFSPRRYRANIFALYPRFAAAGSVFGCVVL